MKKLTMAIVCLFLIGMVFVYADDETGVIRLHDRSAKYDNLKPGAKDFVRPLKSIELVFDGDIKFNSIYKDKRISLTPMPSREQRRLRALLEKLITAYVPSYAGCRVEKKSRYRLIVSCYERIGLDIDESSARFSDVPVAPDADIKVGLKHFVYPVVYGAYYLVDTQNDILLFHKQVSGTGSVADTAIDDFAKQVVLNLAQEIS